MKIKEFFAIVIQRYIKLLLSSIGIVLIPVLFFLHGVLENIFLSLHVTIHSIIWIVLGLIWLLLLVSIALFIFLRKRKGFGLYWDKDYNAFCPICKTLCSYIEHYGYGFGSFYCPKCERDTIPTSKQGSKLTHEEVIGIFQHRYTKKKK